MGAGENDAEGVEGAEDKDGSLFRLPQTTEFSPSFLLHPIHSFCFPLSIVQFTPVRVINGYKYNEVSTSYMNVFCS